MCNAVDGIAGGLPADDRDVWRAAHNVEEPELSLEQFLPIEVAIDLTDEKGPASRSAATIAARQAPVACHGQVRHLPRQY